MSGFSASKFDRIYEDQMKQRESDDQYRNNSG